MDIRTRGFFERVSVEDALKLVLSKVKPLRAEGVKLDECLGRVLALDAVANENNPPFDRAAMDGYALRGENTFGASQSNPIYFRIVGEVATGSTSDLRIKDFEAARIMTGGAMPRGANAVVMFEYTKERGENLEVLRAVTPGKNVSLRGEDVKKGSIVLKRGRKIRPCDIGVMAAAGITKVEAYRRPEVVVISTGDELRAPGEKLSPGKVYDVNTHLLSALVERCGGIPKRFRIVKDDCEELEWAIKSAVGSAAGAVILSGATSVGRKDVVPEVIGRLGEVLFHGVAMHPGGPTGCGVVEGKLVFMLPGYPAASFFGFETFVRPAMQKMQGLSSSSPHRVVTGTLQKKIASEIGRLDFVRASVRKSKNGFEVIPVAGGSGVISSLARADGFFVVPENREGIEKGKQVQVYLFEESE